MAYEVTFPLGNRSRTAFLQEGFYVPGSPSPNLHRHTYGEIHAVSGGAARFLIGTDTYDFREGDLFAVPPGVFHMCLFADPGVIHTAFQTDAELPGFTRCHVSSALLNEFLSELRTFCPQTGGPRICAFLCFLCGELCPQSIVPLQESTDQAFLIHEFFSHNYRREATLSELAGQLHFSEKHTARLVLKHTGLTFTQALTAQRMTIARHLAATTDMSLGEIARYVGYQSYSGFWKVYSKNRNL